MEIVYFILLLMNITGIICSIIALKNFHSLFKKDVYGREWLDRILAYLTKM